MRATVGVQSMAAAVRAASRSASSRGPVGMWHCVCIDARRPNSVTVTGYDGEVSLEAVVDGEVEQEGSVLVLPDGLAEVVAAWPYQQATLETDPSGDLVVSQPGTEYTLQAFTYDYVRPPEELGGEPDVVIQTGQLRKATDDVLFALPPRKEARPGYALMSIHMELGPSELRMVATDKLRMAVRDVAVAGRREVDADVPGAGWAEIVKVLPEGDVELRFSDEVVEVRCGNMRATAALTDSAFPDYRRVIPDAEDTRRVFALDADEWKRCLKRLAVLARQASERVAYTFDDESVKMSVTTGASGSASEWMDVESLRGSGEFSIWFSCKFVQDFLAHCAGRVLLHVTEPLSAALLVPEGRDDYKYVLMPMLAG